MATAINQTLLENLEPGNIATPLRIAAATPADKGVVSYFARTRYRFPIGLTVKKKNCIVGNLLVSKRSAP